MRILMLVPAVICVFASRLPAQDTNELLNRMKALEDRIRALEAEVQALKAPQAAVAPGAAETAVTPQPPIAPEVAQTAPAAPPTAPAVTAEQTSQTGAAPPVYGGAGAAAAKVFNPDISLIGDFLGAVGNAGSRFTPSLEMHESELGLQAIIDPYARGDVFLTFGEEGVALEEGYFTFTSLPGAFQLKVGKMRAAFGKVNTMHNHTLPWTDRPLVTQNLLGGEDGINDAGFSLSRIIPAPKSIFLEGTAQLYRGDSGNVFHAGRRGQVSTVGHLRAYRDITESTNIDLGGSFSQGHSPFGSGTNRLWGVDATFRWKPLRRAIYHSFVARSEFVWARTGAQATLIQSTLPSGEVFGTAAKPFGYYASGDYQLARRWFLGGRFDRSERGACLPTDPAGSEIPCTFFAPRGSRFDLPLVKDTGGSVLLTYWPSEFSQIRGQLRRTAYGDGRTANEALFQFLLSMGAHGAHPF